MAESSGLALLYTVGVTLQDAAAGIALAWMADRLRVEKDLFREFTWCKFPHVDPAFWMSRLCKFSRFCRF
jgi:hypothetical protein